MNREEYNSCVARGMSGKHLTGDERKLEFCTVAKLCSGKSKSREEAVRMCNEPKPDKPAKTPRVKRSKSMLGDNCGQKMEKLHTCLMDNLKPSSGDISESLRYALGKCACGKGK